LWIRIRIDFGRLDPKPDPDPGGKNDPKNMKNVKKFHENTRIFCLGSGSALILIGWIPMQIQEGNNDLQN